MPKKQSNSLKDNGFATGARTIPAPQPMELARLASLMGCRRDVSGDVDAKQAIRDAMQLYLDCLREIESTTGLSDLQIIQKYNSKSNWKVYLDSWNEACEAKCKRFYLDPKLAETSDGLQYLSERHDARWKTTRRFVTALHASFKDSHSWLPQRVKVDATGNQYYAIHPEVVDSVVKRDQERCRMQTAARKRRFVQTKSLKNRRVTDGPVKP